MSTWRPSSPTPAAASSIRKLRSPWAIRERASFICTVLSCICWAVRLSPSRGAPSMGVWCESLMILWLGLAWYLSPTSLVKLHLAGPEGFGKLIKSSKSLSFRGDLVKRNNAALGLGSFVEPSFSKRTDLERAQFDRPFAAIASRIPSEPLMLGSIRSKIIRSAPPQRLPPPTVQDQLKGLK